jgi:hypothetical protein
MTHEGFLSFFLPAAMRHTPFGAPYVMAEAGMAGLLAVLTPLVFKNSMTPPNSEPGTKQWRYARLSEHYLCMTLYGWWVLWMDWDNYRLFLTSKAVSASFPCVILYLMQVYYYIWELAAMGLTKAKREKDFERMLFHHLLTLGLLFGSVWAGYMRIGVLVLLLHDVTDVFLYQSQSWQIYHRETGEANSYLTACWATFLLAFTSCRVIALPVLIRHLMHDPQYALLPSTEQCPTWLIAGAINSFVPAWNYAWVMMPSYFLGLMNLVGMAPPSDCPIYFGAERALPAALVGLWLLQLTWYWDIIKMTYRMFTRPEGIDVEDVRATTPRQKVE